MKHKKEKEAKPADAKLSEELVRQKDELFEKLQRVSADYANFQKRVLKQIADTVSYEKEKIIKSLLPALDNFEHTLQNASSADNIDVLIKGVQIVYDQILDILKSHNVEQIKAVGEKFDPALHQAMMQKEKPDKENNTVLEEFQTGYKLNGKVIRPSKVVVNQLPSEESKEETGEQQPSEADIETDSEQ
jgi:molecular chaperone GrpE